MRHDQSLNVITTEAGSQPRASLTDLGRERAWRAARSLNTAGISVIYASSAVRAQQTADIVASHLQLPVVMTADLAEVWLGSKEGATDAATLRHTADVLRAWLGDGRLDDRVANGETSHDVANRVTSVLRRIGETHVDRPALEIEYLASLTTGINALCGNG